MAELLFEIFSEEIPARMQQESRDLLKTSVQKDFQRADISYKSLNTFVTPRRLLLVAEEIFIVQKEASERKGPAVGANDAAIQGFASSAGISKGELFIKEVNGKEYYFAKVTSGAIDLKDQIIKILEKTLNNFTWKKSMRWDDTSIRWVRPIRNLLCIFDEDVLAVKFGNLFANDQSFGHRFLGADAFIVRNFKEYYKKLQDNYVVLEPDERKKKILSAIHEIEESIGLRCFEDAALLREVVGLVEYPVILLGQIDTEFLSLPKEVLISAIRIHQKYFCLQDRDGNFAPYFIVVSNVITEDDGAQIVSGNEKVLRARLKDARFFIDEDKKNKLSSRVDDLKNIIYHKKLGSVFDKVQRIKKLSEYIANKLGFNQESVRDTIEAAHLSKADLSTNLVYEFPDLQGFAGSYYASCEEEVSEVVAKAIYEHYLPKSAKDEDLPSSSIGAVVSIADKMDSIVGMFYADEAPSSSKDPYALRRSALGVIKIFIDRKEHCYLHEIISESLHCYRVDTEDADKLNLEEKIHEFLYERFRFLLKSYFKEELISAVLEGSCGDLYADYKKLKSLSLFMESKDFHCAAKSIKRTISIVVDNTTDSEEVLYQVNSDLFETDAEKKLFASLGVIKKDVADAIDKKHYSIALEKFIEISADIDTFFDEVMVMADDMSIRKNRLILLQTCKKMFDLFINFSLIEL